MTKKELINRWNSDKGILLLKEIVKGLAKGKNLQSISGLEKHAGRWDLRGAILSEPKQERTIETKGRTAVIKTGKLNIICIQIESIDFSFTDISYALFKKCNIKNCLFEGTIAKEIHVFACDIKDCIFTNVNFSSAFLNSNIGTNSGAFIGCVFHKVNFSNAIFRFPLIKKCLFENCKFSITVFDGSRFVNCKFIGILKSALFMGYSVYASKSVLGLFYRVDPRDYPNKMENVDFSESELLDVSFTHNIDLSNCKLPEGDEYIVIKDIEYTMEKVRKIIDADWQGEDRRLGLGMIDGVYFKKNKHGKGKSIINTNAFPSRNIEFDKTFYDLLRKLS